MDAPVDAAGGDAGSDAGAPSSISDATREGLPVIACDVACPGGPCPVRAGGPTVTATGPFADRVAAFAVGPSDLYYGTISKDIFKRGQLHRVSLSTGADTLVADAVQVSQIHLDTDGTVYFVADQVQSTAVRVLTVAGAGPAMLPSALANGLCHPEHSRGALGARLFTRPAAFTGGGLIAQQKPDSYTRIVAAFSGAPHGLALDDADAYWTNGDGPSRLQSFVRDSISYFDGAATVLTTADDLLVGPLVDGADLYFAHQHAPGACAGSVMTMPTSGGTPRLVSLGNSGSDVSSFAVDDAFVYWTTPDAGRLGVPGGARRRRARGDRGGAAGRQGRRRRCDARLLDRRGRPRRRGAGDREVRPTPGQGAPVSTAHRPSVHTACDCAQL